MTTTRPAPRARACPTLAAVLLGLAGCAGAPVPVSSGRELSELSSPAIGTDAAADDPTATDPDKYRAIFENDRIRVLRYHDEPGERTHPHRHPDSLVYALSSFTRELGFSDGTSKVREFAAGDVMWVPAQVHVGENIGSTPTDVLLVELKQP